MDSRFRGSDSALEFFSILLECKIPISLATAKLYQNFLTQNRSPSILTASKTELLSEEYKGGLETDGTALFFSFLFSRW
jgi:hypothetical protein